MIFPVMGDEMSPVYENQVTAASSAREASPSASWDAPLKIRLIPKKIPRTVKLEDGQRRKTRMPRTSAATPLTRFQVQPGVGRNLKDAP